MPIKTAKTEWRDVILVCKKCTKKLDGGFGPDGDRTLKKALRKYLKAGKGRKSELAVIETGCFDVCPKNAVVAVNTTQPKALLIVPAGADLLEVRSRLGLEAPRRRLARAAPASPSEGMGRPREDLDPLQIVVEAEHDLDLPHQRPIAGELEPVRLPQPVACRPVLD